MIRAKSCSNVMLSSTPSVEGSSGGPFPGMLSPIMLVGITRTVKGLPTIDSTPAPTIMVEGDQILSTLLSESALPPVCETSSIKLFPRNNAPPEQSAAEEFIQRLRSRSFFNPLPAASVQTSVTRKGLSVMTPEIS